jgi:cytochrome c-type biogenesis protein CcmH/NrfG
MLETAVDRDPGRAGAWHDLGVIRVQLGDLAGAEAALRR